MIDNNPLRQYFRRPAIYIRLPSGGKDYAEDVVMMPDNGEIPVFPMTAIDEISAKTPDALFNGVAIVEIIRSCLPAIKDPWRLSSSDVDAVLIAIKAATGTSEIEIESECPACHEVATYGVNLIGILAQLKAGDYTTELVVNELAIKFRPLTFKELNQASLEQFDAQRMFNIINSTDDIDEKNKKSKEVLKTITESTMRVLSNTVDYIKTPGAYVREPEFILDFLHNCDKNMYEKMKAHSTALKQESEIKPLKVKCIHCTHEYQQQFSLNASDFFA
jgi:hypothetical protein